jgi:hypothetical protein
MNGMCAAGQLVQALEAHEHDAAGAVNIDSNIKNDKQAQGTMHPTQRGIQLSQ